MSNKIKNKKYSDIVKKNKNNSLSVFNEIIDTYNISILINQVDKNIDDTLLREMQEKLEGKCNRNGLIKNNSIEIINYSPGVLDQNKVIFAVNYKCNICNPCEGVILDCFVKNITKAGIRAELNGYQNGDHKSPIVIFVARDHHYDNEYFTSLKEDDIIKVKVIGSRFALNDEFISCIAEMNH